jgi:hypothetical protein
MDTGDSSHTRLASLAQKMLADPHAAIDAPIAPPSAWFTKLPDDWDSNGPLIQIDFASGRVAALVAPYGECILNGRAGCWTPPISATNYEYAHVGSVLTAEGDIIRTANIGGGVDHFDPTRATETSLAADHYANTATRRMVGRYVDSPPDGIVFVGSIYPGTTYMQAFECMTSALSGDWRWVQSLNDYEMVGSQLVNNPGFRPNKMASPARLASVVPLRVSTISRFFDVGAKVASAGCSDSDRVVSLWESTESVPAVVAGMSKDYMNMPPVVTNVSAMENGLARSTIANFVDMEMPTSMVYNRMRSEQMDSDQMDSDQMGTTLGQHELNDRQEMQYELIEQVVEMYGKFDKTSGADGAHYVAESPYAEEGTICANCSFYRGPRGCELVEGDIDPNGICKLWIIPGDLIVGDSSDDDDGMDYDDELAEHSDDECKGCMSHGCKGCGWTGYRDKATAPFAYMADPEGSEDGKY